MTGQNFPYTTQGRAVVVREGIPGCRGSMDRQPDGTVMCTRCGRTVAYQAWQEGSNGRP